MGNLTDFRADMLRAKVYSRTYEDLRTDSAIVIGERLMLHDSIKADYDIRQDVLEILQDAYRMEKDYEQALHWALQLSDLFREHDMQTALLRNDAEIGAFMIRIGQQKEGLAKIDSVIHVLHGQRHFFEMDATIIALKRKAEVCNEIGLYAEIIPAAQQILELLNDYEQHPDEFRDINDTGRVISDEERPRYIDFYRSKAYAYMAMAYSLIPDPSPRGEGGGLPKRQRFSGKTIP